MMMLIVLVPILVTPVGIMIVVSFEHPLKAEEPNGMIMLMIDSDDDIDDNDDSTNTSNTIRNSNRCQ